MRRVLVQVLVLLFLGLAAGVAHSWNTTIMLHLPPPAPPVIPDPASGGGTEAAKPPPTVASTPTTPTNPYFIELAEAKRHFDSASAIFIDARDIKEYRLGHIQGAMHLSKDAFGGIPPAKVKNYLPGQRVILYCHGADCSDSDAVIKRLIASNFGIGPYHIIKDGYPGWKAAGYPVEAGDEVGFQ
ncbi:MAG: rhodanese-like domain-containing protein [Phycisphaerales bacterium]